MILQIHFPNNLDGASVMVYVGKSERRLLVLIEDRLLLCIGFLSKFNRHLGGLYLILFADLRELIRDIQHLHYLFRHHWLELRLVLCYAPDSDCSGLVAMFFGGVE